MLYNESTFRELDQLPTRFILRLGLPKSDPKYGARGRSARRLVLWEKIAQPSGPYHRTRQDVKPQAPSCPVLRKPRVLAHRGRKVGPMAVGLIGLLAQFEGRRTRFGGGSGGGDAKSIRSRHYHGVGLARVAVRIKTVVVGWSEVVTMADTPAVFSRQG